MYNDYPLHQKIDMINIDRNLIISFMSHKIEYKKDQDIHFLSRIWGQFSSTALVIDTFYVKFGSVLTQY